MYRWQERRCERLLHVLVDELLSRVFQPFWTFIKRVFEWEVCWNAHQLKVKQIYRTGFYR